MKKISIAIDSSRRRALHASTLQDGEKKAWPSYLVKIAINSKDYSTSASSTKSKRKVLRLLIAMILITMLAAPALQAGSTAETRPTERPATLKSVCGYDPRGAEKEWLNHKANLNRLRRGEKTHLHNLADSGNNIGPRVESVGDIVVIEDDGTIVMPPNKFDLKNSSVLFTPSGNGYMIVRGNEEFDSDFGARLTDFIESFSGIRNSDDGYQNIKLGGAQFPFFGASYDEIFVGTNGYVTFTQGDSEYNPSAATHASELPRIAPLWTDLDARNTGRIYYNRLEGYHLITWSALPHAVYGRSNTFQLVLYDDGRFAFVYKKVKARPSLTGISPGGSVDARPLDLSSPPVESVSGSLFESFVKKKRLDVPALTRAFYSAHGDLFDTLYLWTDFSFDNGLGLAHSFNVRNDIEGIGLERFDLGAVYGSESRLSTVITMGDIKRDWPANPQAHVAGLNSAVSIVCHEQGHRWLVYVRFDDRRAIRDDLLGRDRSHWSFLAETRTSSEGAFSSLMEGNAWRDNGNGSFTTIESAVNYFSDLDQYLMGLRSKDEVADIDYLDVAEDLKEFLRSRSPVAGFTLSATRKSASVDQIISREGERLPDAQDAPKDFRIAFVLLTERGASASSAIVNKMDRYRDALVKYFSVATSRRASLDSSLVDSK